MLTGSRRVLLLKYLFVIVVSRWVAGHIHVVDDGRAEPRRNRALPATLGTLAVAAALVAAVLVSLVPAHGFGPLLPVGRVLKEHARHRHDATPERDVVEPDTARHRPD